MATTRVAAPRKRNERGFTLVELLMTVMVMGIAFATLLGGLSSLYGDGDSQRKLSVTEVWVRRYAEQLDGASYVACAQASDYAAALTPAPPTNYAVQITTIEYWNGDASATFGSSRTTCQSNGDKGVERITLTVTNSEVVRPVTQSVVVLKRDPA